MPTQADPPRSQVSHPNEREARFSVLKPSTLTAAITPESRFPWTRLSGAIRFVCFGSEFNLSANLSRLSPTSTGFEWLHFTRICLYLGLAAHRFHYQTIRVRVFISLQAGPKEISVHFILEAGLSRNLGRTRGLFMVPTGSCGDVGSSSLDFQSVWFFQAEFFQASWGGCSFRCRRVLAGWTLLWFLDSSPVFPPCLPSSTMYRVVAFSL
ncbi:hypothetical protein FPV67DRAFT_630711 [Lyophyllum atratum]|nr:hypothetical protein FPV67DRAFT_630711 [Lyophyllum atratum]